MFNCWLLIWEKNSEKLTRGLNCEKEFEPWSNFLKSSLFKLNCLCSTFMLVSINLKIMIVVSSEHLNILETFTLTFWWLCKIKFWIVTNHFPSAFCIRADRFQIQWIYPHPRYSRTSRWALSTPFTASEMHSFPILLSLSQAL